MAAAQINQTYEEIIKDIRAKRFKPVYLFMGFENYYIDNLVNVLLDSALKEDEKDFNLTTFFGADADIKNVIGTAQSFPMSAEHSVVLVKEAQDLQKIEDLVYYLQYPQPTTILVFVYKNGIVDRRKKFVSLIASIGVVFESKRVNESQLPNLIRSYVKMKGYNIDNKSEIIIAESIGADLIRLYGELDKLFIAMPNGQKSITPEFVEANIGISKDFNYFELQNALIVKDAKKAFQIVKYFGNTPKVNPIQKILPMLSRFFSTLMMAYYAPQKTIGGISKYLGQTEWQVKSNICPAMKIYSARKVLEILDEIRTADEKSKGYEGSKLSGGDVLKQLIAFILN